MAIDFMEVLLTIGAVILIVVAVYLYIHYRKSEKKSELSKDSDLQKQVEERPPVLTTEARTGTEEVKIEELPEVEEKKDTTKKPEKKEPGAEKATPKKKAGQKKKTPVRKPRKKAEPEKGKSLF
ncbi:MAG: hypothetical protein J5U17_07910 [Candidatus Methanoperedens sp.]|nr:hypothetical protein [Candidatus Methanoperedens sp.]MCE8429266.1 hypothetical protein [Candidatus Methanoperedens sp.]